MGLIGAVSSSVGIIVFSAFAKLVADDAKEWAPKVIARALAFSVKLLPRWQRTRYREEWAAHIADMPGIIAKLIVVAQLPFAAVRAREQDADRAELWIEELLKEAEFVSREIVLICGKKDAGAPSNVIEAEIRALDAKTTLRDILERAPDLRFTRKGLSRTATRWLRRSGLTFRRNNRQG